jgi:hypothetical protein
MPKPCTSSVTSVTSRSAALSPTRSHKDVTTSPSSALSSELRPGSHCSMPLPLMGVSVETLVFCACAAHSAHTPHTRFAVTILGVRS